MINNPNLDNAKELIASEQYKEALEVVSTCIDNCNHTNEAYILKAKALAGLGRICEIGTSFGSRINWKNPSENDLAMVELTEKSCEANNWNLARYQFNHIHSLMLQTPEGPISVEVRTKINSNLQALDDRPTDEQVFLDLTWLYCAQNDIVKSAFYQMAYRHFCQEPIPIDELDSSTSLSHFTNVSNIYMYLANKRSGTIAFIIERDEDTYEYEKMARTLLLMNNKVIIILISSKISVDTGDNRYNIEHFLNLSFAKKEIKDGIEYYPVVQITRNGVKVENTALPLLNKIAINSGGHLPVFAELSTLDNLESRHTSRKEIHYVCNGFNFKNAKSCTCFAYIRGYEQYISKLYDIDVKSQLTAESECAFSIVLPVRNNVATLPHTLKTCMEQSFNDYEIVVSDNSDEGNNSVYELINELKCDKIKYYKTPRNLPLTKSFEFAYLQAKGEFLVPIGADDGILHNGLETIDKALQRYPDEDILLWDRLHYVWPNFIFENQSNQFIIPKPYIPNSFNIKKVNCPETLNSVLQLKQSIYGIPLLYINSGMRRRYLLKMLDRTGAIIDGISQDVYTGLVNLAINKEFTFLQYPITIAGLSSNSTGGISSTGNSDLKVQQKSVDELLNTNFGHHMPRKLESIIPTSTKVGDISNLIMSALRLIDMQCIDRKMLHCIDWKQAFRKITEQHHANDINLETSISRLLDAAKDISPEIYDWYVGELRSNKLRFISDKPDSKKNYYKGFSPNSSLNLDAGDFGISNVYEAAKFVEKLLNL